MEDMVILNLLKKQRFVDRVAEAICGQERISVEDIKYEVYESNEFGYYDEFIKMVYSGGAIAIRVVTGTSESCIFQEIAKMINGGYYDEVKAYTEMAHSPKYTQIL